MLSLDEMKRKNEKKKEKKNLNKKKSCVQGTIA
jgi:hypothetical protein